jgi:hypothetical protein
MQEGGYVRAFLSAALLLATAGCADTTWPPQWVWTPTWWSHPGQLTLSNYRFTIVSVQAVMATGPECAPGDPSASATAFELPYKGSHVLVATPNADVCWRRQLANGQWTDWNRAFTGSGRHIDAQL